MDECERCGDEVDGLVEIMVSPAGQYEPAEYESICHECDENR